jgi:uncharacterized protein YjbJ (UPF0337 family)
MATPISTKRRTTMDKHQVKGRIKEASGKIKEEVGKALGNERLQNKGTLEKNIGKVESKYGDLKSDIKKDLEEEDDT